MQIFDKIIFFKYKTRQIQTTETNKKATISFKISNFLICFGSFDLSCHTWKRQFYWKYVYFIVLLNSFLFVSIKHLD